MKVIFMVLRKQRQWIINGLGLFETSDLYGQPKTSFSITVTINPPPAPPTLPKTSKGKISEEIENVILGHLKTKSGMQVQKGKIRKDDLLRYIDESKLISSARKKWKLIDLGNEVFRLVNLQLNKS